MILSKEFTDSREKVLKKLKDADINYRIITGGNILKHDVAKYFDKEVTKRENADYAHDNGFFIGNAPIDLTKEIDYLFETLREI